VVIGIGTVAAGTAAGAADRGGRVHPLPVAPGTGCRRRFGSGSRPQRGAADAL